MSRRNNNSNLKDSASTVVDRLRNRYDEWANRRFKLKHSVPLARRPLLRSLVGKRGIVFHSDYAQLDNKYVQILTLFDKAGTDRKLPPFWMTYLVPRSLGDHAVARLIMPITTMTDAWVDKHQAIAEGASQSQKSQAKATQSAKYINQFITHDEDMQYIASDLQEGDKYLAVDFKLLIKADSLNALDAARLKIEQKLKQDGFAGIFLAPFEGQQRQDFSNLLMPADHQLGMKKMFTSYELAGGYNLLTHGITDPAGKFVGLMEADFNDAAVLFDIDNFDDNVVFASKDAAVTENYNHNHFMGQRNSTLWGVKIAQSALIDNHRVVHFILNGTKPQNVGADLSSISTVVNMNTGAINPFQMFGSRSRQFTIWSAHNEMLRVMAKQIDPNLKPFDLNKTLGDVLEQFYVDQRMWTQNPQQNQDRVRIVGLPNNQYPLLKMFNTYLSTQIDAENEHHNMPVVASLQRLQGVFERLQRDDGDLFDVYTDNTVQQAELSPQVFYDFSEILDRSTDTAMAQLVNAIGYATNGLIDHDVLIIHGVDDLAGNVKPYMSHILERLRKRGVRIVYLYDNVDECLDDDKFCQLTHADYTMFGTMTKRNVETYEKLIDTKLPGLLRSQITLKNPTQMYLARGMDKIVFKQALVLE